MPTRPPLDPAPSSSNDHVPQPPRQAALSPGLPHFLAGLNLHIIPAKLSTSQLAHLCCLAESHGATLVPSPQKADVVLTAVSARKRLERHMPLQECEKRWVFSTQWLEDSAAAGGAKGWDAYLAVPGMKPREDEEGAGSRGGTPGLTASAPSTAPSSPGQKPVVDADGVRRKLEALGLPSTPEPGNRKKRKRSSSPSSPSLAAQPGSGAATPSPAKLPKYNPNPTRAEEDTLPLTFTPGWPLPNSRYACKRRTPLFTPNKELLDMLVVIMRSRELEGEDRSALSYARGISVLKAYPREITSTAQIRSLPGIGPKIISLVEQYITTGHISETDAILSSDRYRALEELTRVHSVGSTTARALYARGVTGVEELREWVGMGNGGEVLRMALEIHEDLMIRIPRPEVELIASTVQQALDQILPGCMHTICGGHRRGKPTSGDVDIVFTHREQGKEQGLVERLVNYLSNTGFITHIFGVMHPGHNPFSTSSHTRSKLRPNHPSSHFDTLSKALVVCKPTKEMGGAGIHRRLDLICAPRDVYWAAVVGWSGSKQFERDLRLWAKEEMGIKFDSSGLTRLRDTQPIYIDSEREIFEFLGLEYVPPRWRNADM